MPALAGFRVASWDTPLRVNPNRQAGRWNEAGSGATQYIALHPLASWAEYLRWHDLRDSEAVSQLRLAVWAIRVIVEEVYEIRYDNASRVGLQAEELVADDWSACQAAARRLWADRAAPRVLETPSAALPGARNIVILGERVAVPYAFEPVDSIDLPAGLAAAAGRPPKSLVDLVRYRGEAHPEFEAWKRGDRYELQEPHDTLLAEDARGA